MLSLSLPVEIFLYAEPADLRKSYDSLAALAREHLDRNVLDGGLFVFLNRRHNRIKLLYWDRDGLAIWQKRLERGTFIAPQRAANQASVTLTPAELALLLAGLEVITTRRSPRYQRAAVPTAQRVSG
jgi:transposase